MNLDELWTHLHGMDTTEKMEISVNTSRKRVKMGLKNTRR